MTIQDILFEHQLYLRQGEPVWRCECGNWEDDTCAQEENHRAHVAQVLDAHMQERVAAAKAEALNEAATKLADASVSPIWCWVKCGDPKCPDDIRVGAATEIQKWLRGRAGQYKETP